MVVWQGVYTSPKLPFMAHTISHLCSRAGTFNRISIAERDRQLYKDPKHEIHVGCGNGGRIRISSKAWHVDQVTTCYDWEGSVKEELHLVYRICIHVHDLFRLQPAIFAINHTSQAFACQGENHDECTLVLSKYIINVDTHLLEKQ